MKKEQLKVGQKVYILNLNSYRQGKAPLKEVEVTRVGNLYFETSVKGYGKFFISNMLQQGDGSANYKAYFSQEEYDQECEKRELIINIKQFFNSYFESINTPLESLREINELITKKE